MGPSPCPRGESLQPSWSVFPLVPREEPGRCYRLHTFFSINRANMTFPAQNIHCSFIFNKLKKSAAPGPPHTCGGKGGNTGHTAVTIDILDIHDCHH